MCADVCISAGKAGFVGGEQHVEYFQRSPPPSRRGILSGLALAGTVCCASQRLVTFICFGSPGTANNLDAGSGYCYGMLMDKNSQFRGKMQEFAVVSQFCKFYKSRNGHKKFTILEMSILPMTPVTF